LAAVEQFEKAQEDEETKAIADTACTEVRGEAAPASICSALDREKEVIACPT